MKTIITPNESSNHTFILVGGLGAVAESWSVATSELATVGTVITFDRAGIGMSDGPRPTWGRMVQCLDAVTDQVTEEQRLTVVGHSLGGLIVRDWVRRNPGRASLIVYLDATHEDQLRRSPKQERGAHWMRQELAIDRLRARLRPRAFLEEHHRQWLSGDLDEQSQLTIRSLSITPRHCDAVYGEFAAWMRRQRIATVHPLTRIEPIVLSVTAESTAQDDPHQLDLHQETAGAVNHGEHRIVEGADHFNIVTSRSAVRQWTYPALAM